VEGVQRRKKQPGILKALDELLKDATAGDPITGLKWTRKTAANWLVNCDARDTRFGTVPFLVWCIVWGTPCGRIGNV